MEEAKHIKIGEYEICSPKGSTIWIYHGDGEGMQTDTKKLEKVIKEFYDREF